MFCPHCGAAIPEGAYFCQKCGAASSADAAVTPGAAIASPGGVAGVPFQPKTSGLAIASLISGLLFFLFIPAILAIIFGHIALSQIKRSAGQLTGRGLAIAGLVLGYLEIAMIPFTLIIAAIAIPNLLRARMAANESSAVASIRTMEVAEISYSYAHPEKGFTCELGDLREAGISPGLAGSTKNGYVFELVGCSGENPGGPNTKFQVIGYPITKGTTGQKAFCSDETNVVRYDTSGSGQSCLENGIEMGK